MIKMDFTLENFVNSCLERAGALVERPGYALTEALLPDELVPLFNQGHLLLAFDYEVAGETPGAAFVTYGSPLLDNVARLARQWGKHTRLYWPACNYQPPANLEERVRSGVSYLNCRPPRVILHRTRENLFLGFFYRCVYRSHDKREEMVQVIINGYSGQPQDDHFMRGWESSLPLEEPDYTLAPASRLPGEELYRRTYPRVEGVVREQALQVKEASRNLMARELDKIKSYYLETTRDLERKKAVAPDQAKVVRLEKQLAATRADWKRREEDIAERYQVEVDVYLDHLVSYRAPCEFIKVQVQHKKNVLEQELIYNPVTGNIEAPACAGCNKAVRALVPGPEEKLVCQGCRELPLDKKE